MKKVYHIVKRTSDNTFFKMADTDFRFGTKEYETIGKLGKTIAKLRHANGYAYTTHRTAGSFWGVFPADFSAFKI